MSSNDSPAWVQTASVTNFTVEAPATWTRPWSGEIPVSRFEGPIFEYACHEGNYGLVHILKGARAEETAAARAAQKGSR
jgi:hypothetical protein